MLTEEEKKHIHTAAQSGSLLANDLKEKYINELQNSRPYAGLILECCELPTGGAPVTVPHGHCASLGGNVVDPARCALVGPPHGHTL